MNDDSCRELLSEALDLCIRARSMDAIDRTAAQVAISSADKDWWDANLAARAARHNAMFPDQPMSSRSMTLPMWVQDQYDKDLAEWERKTRHYLQQGN